MHNPARIESAEDIVYRRDFMTGASAVWLTTETASAGGTPRKPDIQEIISALSDALREKHGGEWVATTDSKNQFVLICRA